ncbi:MAG: hypothetical protein R2697_02540 [Ilumatobacteraceae bacterium]
MATRHEWNHDANPDWSLHDVSMHAGVRMVLAELNRLYQAEPALHRWRRRRRRFGHRDAMGRVATPSRSVFALLRTDLTGEGRPVLVVMNATPILRHNYRLAS